jgi:hypothetical protein
VCNEKLHKRDYSFVKIDPDVELLDVPARVDELRFLKDGWLDGHGTAPSDVGLTWFSQVFDKRFPDRLQLPYLYPTEEGGLRAEWSGDGREMSLDVDLDSHTAQWYSWYQPTDEEETATLNLDDEDGWKRLATLVAGETEKAELSEDRDDIDDDDELTLRTTQGPLGITLVGMRTADNKPAMIVDPEKAKAFYQSLPSAAERRARRKKKD